MENLVVQTTGLTKVYNDLKVVDNLNLAIREGRIYGFLGPNGAGKSTTIGMLLGLIKSTNGKVKLFGKDLNKHKMSILHNVGSMIESPAYYGNLTAYENLKISADILGADKKSIDDVLKFVKLDKWKTKKAKEFSLGMKQRLGIAEALIGNPKLLILDEPTNGLDPLGIQEIRELIKSLPKKFNMSVIISSHILSEIELMADDIGIINDGRLLFQGTLKELKDKNTNSTLEEIFFNVLKNGVETLV